MKKIGMLLILGLMCVANNQQPTFADSASYVLNRAELGLQTDCQKLVKDCRRARVDFDRFLRELLSFNFNDNLATEGAYSRRNTQHRAYVWANSTLYKVGHTFEQIKKHYQHCVCIAGSIGAEMHLKELLEQMQDEFVSLEQNYLNLLNKLTDLRDRAGSKLL